VVPRRTAAGTGWRGRSRSRRRDRRCGAAWTCHRRGRPPPGWRPSEYRQCLKARRRSSGGSGIASERTCSVVYKSARAKSMWQTRSTPSAPGGHLDNLDWHGAGAVACASLTTDHSADQCLHPVEPDM
jgi:hypothetical protein